MVNALKLFCEWKNFSINDERNMSITSNWYLVLKFIFKKKIYGSELSEKPDPDPEETASDPQHCCSTSFYIKETVDQNS